MRIDNRINGYLKGLGGKITDSEICSWADKDPNMVLKIFFKVINEQLDTYKGDKSLDKVCELVGFVKTVLENYDNVDRRVAIRKLSKVYVKIDCIKLEKKKKFVDASKALKELDKVSDQVDDVLTNVSLKNTKQFDCIYCLIESVKNIKYIEYFFDKIPTLVNVRDKNNYSLLQNMIWSYLDSVEEENEEDIFYYRNIISLILSRRSFSMSEKDKKIGLNSIYTQLNQISSSKKSIRENKHKIEMLKDLLKVIKEYDEKKPSINQIASKYNIAVSFPDDIMDKIQFIDPVSSNQEYKKIKDFVVTIDKSSVVEIDDGISCRKLSNGNYLLGVHISSVLGYFPYESPIIDEAISRNRVIHLPKKYQNKTDDFNQLISIFPYQFSVNVASLVPNQERYARSYYYEITPSGEIVQEKFIKSVVKSDARLTFKDVDYILKNGSNQLNIQDTLQCLQEVTAVLENRFKKIDVSLLTETDSNSMINAQKMVLFPMLLTGERVANYFAENQYPCLYRVLELNEQDLVKTQKIIESLTRSPGGDKYKRLSKLLNGLYPNGKYDIVGRHDLLHLDHYCHCTAELMRGADIVLDHALDVCYDRNVTDSDLIQLEEELTHRAGQLNAGHYPIEWFIDDYGKTYQKH